ncbi:MAG TPA: LLM class flavin-dependent oxidoreductase, partial [Candidatus Entotheonella sp.]
MKFGLKLHHSGPGASPAYMLRWTRFAETLGLHLIMTADHAGLTPDVLAQYPDPYYEPFTNMAWLAAKTRAIELGTTVIVVPYRHPIHLAHLTANV